MSSLRMVIQGAEWVKLTIASVLVIGFVFLGITRLLNYRQEKSSGVTKRVIQYNTVVLLVPVIALLALEGTIGGESLTAIYGTIVGYTLTDFDGSS